MSVQYSLFLSLSAVQGQAINQSACSIAKEVASEGDALVAGGICQTPSYLSGKGKAAVQQEFQKQVEVFVQNDLDFIICEVIHLVICLFTSFHPHIQSNRPISFRIGLSN